MAIQPYLRPEEVRVTMLANFEPRNYEGKEQVWSGRYRNLHNLPHWHLESELIYVEHGQAAVSHNHQEYSLAKGDAIFLGSGEIHYIKSDADSIVAVTMFDSALISDLCDTACLRSAKLEHHYPIPEYFADIRRELTERPPFFELQSCECIISLMIRIFRGEELMQKTAAQECSSIANYKDLLTEIEKRYNYITFSDAAAFMGLSEPYFSKFFRKISGMTFSQYLNSVRLEHAVEMLKNNSDHLSITEIASLCGFDTIRHFNRVFKDITGMSPRQMPAGYVTDFQTIRTIREAFDPTLQSSELL